MKVCDLLEILQDFDPQTEVHISYNCGDYWRTEVAPCVSSVNDALVVYSTYHEMDKVVDEDSFEEDDEEVKRVVIFSA